MRRAKINLILILALSIFFAFGITKLQMQMGNDVFVDKSTDVYKNTVTYQKNFGGDSIYILLSGKKDELISKRTSQEMVNFTKKANKIKDITGSTSYIGLMNEMLSSENSSMSMVNSNNAKLEAAMMNAISKKKLAAIQENMRNSLSQKQKADIQNYTLVQLTNEQKQEFAQKIASAGQNLSSEQQSVILESILTKEQNGCH